MRNLLGRLHDRAPHDLELIARWWEVDPGRRDRYAIAGLLYRTMTDPWAYALAWEQLSPFEQTLLELLTADESLRTVAQLTELLGAPLETVRGIVNRLFRIGFIYVEQDESELPEERDVQDPYYFLPRELSQLTARLKVERDEGIPVALSVEELLDRHNDGALADIAEHMGRQIIPAVAIRRDLIAQISPRLSDPDHIRDTVRSLNPTVARVWRWLLDHDKPGAPAELREGLGLSNAELRLAAQTLARRGLIWRGYEEDGTLRLVIPDVLRHPRKPTPPSSPRIERVTADLVEPIDWIYPYAAVWDLLTVVRSVDVGWLVRRRGELDGRATALRRLARVLWHGGDEVPPNGYMTFLDFLARALGLFDQDGRRVATTRMNEWSRQSFPRLLSDMVGIWLQATTWAEVAERDALQVWGGDWPGFRLRLRERLGEIPAGDWITIDSFSKKFAVDNPVALGAHFTAALSHESMPESSDERRQAVLQTAAETTMITAGAWLGVVDLSSSRRRAVVSLTDAGAWLCNRRDDPPEEVELGAHPLTVQPNFEILLFRPSPRRVWALSAFADVDHLDHVSTYQLTRASVERGLSAGLSATQIIGFLEQQGEEPLPQNVSHEIESWARNFRRVLVREGVLLDIDDTDAAATIRETLRSAGFRFETLPRDRLLITGREGSDDEDLAETIEEQLRELGQTPLRPSR